MRNRKIRYIVFGIVLGLLIAGNAAVHIISINLSEQALTYEKEINVLKQSNIQLESEVLTHGSLQAIAAVAATQGYKTGDASVRWVDPVIALR